MSGLVSKWATESPLDSKPVHQETKTNPSPNKDKWSKPITSNKSLPLVSKWASAPDEPDLTPIEIDQPKHRQRRSKHQDVPASPPLSTDGDSRRHGRHDRHRRKSKDETRPKGGRNGAEPPEEKLPPMTDAAKSFAARLGALKGPVSPPSSSERHETHHHSHENSGRKAPLLQNNPLAARLGLDPEKPKGRGQQRAPKAKPRDRNGRNSDRGNRPGAKAAPVEEKQPGPDEIKAEEELRQLLDKLDAKELDWASFE
ncbi:uncharacterized protein CANTADRAFT_5216 [Suhomyces tanzawaensis NRRL Y-17324]|uniref:Uncharacterized protein n=1 Tax=Suhomyces tanzawaensis NRRL Y-17324 TaxID=984487 RepID=A0A1E4SP08_9ASCO|nr:uncharacterized protein CANTADRAFT_5216 [Suhomyces tanzawaensis NRRL Y-17324]ODV81259.1 hypothetical protein CANTADRAFT_5216 [Suhomyces tanzawaensis NRRL Y-17324]